ncbi:MAG TPA: hypothetical protein VKX16_08930, partial [Chloroflexota bacterium]|nr:hypothetical protein [Chloroflexota bacterium]
FEPRVMRTQFVPGAVIEPLSRVMDSLPDRWPRPARLRSSPPGRVAAFCLWRGLDVLGWPLGMAGLGDLVELYAVRVPTGRQ